jgi:hypothetical protein
VVSPPSLHSNTSHRRPYQSGHLATASHPYAREQTQPPGVRSEQRFGALGSGGLGLSNDLGGDGSTYFEDESNVAMLSKFGRQVIPKISEVSLSYVSPQNQYSNTRPSMYQQPSEPIFDIMQSGWSPDLPDRISMAN